MTLEVRPLRKWRYEDYAALPADGLRHEIVDGEHFVNAAPSVSHQRVLVRLAHLLFSAVVSEGRGEVFVAPLDVELSEFDVVQPDLVVVLAARRSILTKSRVQGVPDLLIEIVSPSTERLDRSVKKARYERVGVPEYWIVDPETRAIEQFVLREGRYEIQGAANDTLRLHVAPDVMIPLADVW